MAGAVSDVLVGIATTLGSGGALGVFAYLRSHRRDHDETHERLARIEAEFQPNHGTSARDLQEEILTTLRHLSAAQGIHPPPRRTRPRREERQ